MALQSNKLIFCSDGIYPLSVGGMQRHSRMLIETIASLSDYKITVIHPHQNQTLFSNYSNIDEVSLPYKTTGNYLLNCYNYSKHVYGAISKFSDQLIYAQGLAVWYGISEIGDRLIDNPHGLEPYQGITFRDKITTLPFRIILNRIFSQSLRVVSLGGNLTPILINKAGVDADKIVELPNAIQLVQPVFRKFDNDKFQLLFVGRFAHNKGIPLLMQAANRLNAEGFASRITFHLVGKGPLYEELLRENNADNIILHGFGSDEKLKELYSSCDAFVFPTLFEGMPTVVLEAMTYGMPVIVSNTGATAELVDSTNGFLIPANDAESLISAIKKFVALSADERLTLSQASMAKVNARFTWQKVAQAHIDLFNYLIGESKT